MVSITSSALRCAHIIIKHSCGDWAYNLWFIFLSSIVRVARTTILRLAVERSDVIRRPSRIYEELYADPDRQTAYSGALIHSHLSSCNGESTSPSGRIPIGCNSPPPTKKFDHCHDDELHNCPCRTSCVQVIIILVIIDRLARPTDFYVYFVKTT